MEWFTFEECLADITMYVYKFHTALEQKKYFPLLLHLVFNLFPQILPHNRKPQNHVCFSI